MNDLNFFSVLKKQKQKNKPIRIMVLAAVALILLINIAVISVGLIAFARLNDQISRNQAFIDSPDTKARVSEIQKVDKEATVAQDYLKLLQTVAAKIGKTDLIKLEMIDYIRSLTPATTVYRRVEYDHANINLDCFSTQIPDAMGLYHRLNDDDHFSYVSMTEVVIAENGTVTFSIRLTQKGE